MSLLRSGASKRKSLSFEYKSENTEETDDVPHCNEMTENNDINQHVSK